MTRRTYNAGHLATALRSFEDRYAMTSEEFVTAFAGNESIRGIPGFSQHVWADMYAEYSELTGDARRPSAADPVLTA